MHLTRCMFLNVFFYIFDLLLKITMSPWWFPNSLFCVCVLTKMVLNLIRTLTMGCLQHKVCDGSVVIELHCDLCVWENGLFGLSGDESARLVRGFHAVPCLICLVQPGFQKWTLLPSQIILCPCWKKYFLFIIETEEFEHNMDVPCLCSCFINNVVQSFNYPLKSLLLIGVVLMTSSDV